MSAVSVLTLPVSHASRIRPGDVVIAVDGRPVKPKEVAASLGPVGAARGIRLTAPQGSNVEHVFYPDTQAAATVTVERTAPPRRPRRSVTRRFAGLALHTRPDEGGWWTADDRYHLHENPGYVTECDNPHPARLTVEAIEMAKTHPADFARIYDIRVLRGLRESGYRHASYYCDGEREHGYSRWVIWSGDDYPRWTGPDGYDTLTDAARDLAEHLSGEEGLR